MNIERELSNLLQRIEPVPFLFIGSGLSRRYINSEDWIGLLDLFGNKIGINIRHLLSLEKINGSCELAASEISPHFTNYFFKNDEYLSIREKYSSILGIGSKAKDLPLKIAIAEHFLDKSKSLFTNLKYQQEIEQLKNVSINGVITTNYDLMLENIFSERKFTPYIGQKNMIFGNTLWVNEIYKIHGCCLDPPSIIITNDDYSDFQKNYSYLSAKLLTLFLENPIIFLGYALSDRNIQEIFNNIGNCFSEDNISRLRDRIIIVEWDENNEGDLFESSSKQIGSLSIPYTKIRTDDYVSIYRALSTPKNEKGYPAWFLRKFKDKISILIKTQDPAAKLFVKDIDDPNLFDGEIAVGFGVKEIIKYGYIRYEQKHLINDILFPKDDCDHHKIVTKLLPQILNETIHIPIFKYLTSINYINNNSIDEIKIDPKIVKRINRINSGNAFKPTDSYKKIIPQLEEMNWNFQKMKESHDICHLLKYILFIPRERINLNELLTFLRENYTKSVSNTCQTDYNKIVCYFDWLKYGNGAIITIINTPS